jgi:hypothetical protein
MELEFVMGDINHFCNDKKIDKIQLLRKIPGKTLYLVHVIWQVQDIYIPLPYNNIVTIEDKTKKITFKNNYEPLPQIDKILDSTVYKNYPDLKNNIVLGPVVQHETEEFKLNTKCKITKYYICVNNQLEHECICIFEKKYGWIKPTEANNILLVYQENGETHVIFVYST